MKERVDLLLQRRHGLSRSKAQGLILTGKVSDTSGRRFEKPGERVPAETELVIEDGPGFVSRGGEKLEAALTEFGIDVIGVVAIDAGASTGGFTDCLLQHGAAKVYAVDVGYGQLAWPLREDPRVVVMERTNIRYLTPDELDDRPSFFTADCSFISLRLVLPALFNVTRADASGVVLIKPQFEAGPEHVNKGGVVTSARVREESVKEITAFAEETGFTVLGVMESPLTGPAGNREYLAHLRKKG